MKFSDALKASCEDDYDWNRIVEEVARVNNATILRPKPNQLFLDFDTEKQFEELPEKLADLLKGHPDEPYHIKEWFSKSGPPKRHVVITFAKKTFSPGERVLFQLLLGSDPKREFLDGRRLFHGVSNENTTCFFEPIK